MYNTNGDIMENENKHTYDNGFHPKEVVLDKNYKFYNRSFIFRLGSKLILYLTRVWIIFPKIFMGVKIRGRKNLKKVKGALVVSNHIHPLDAFFLASSFYFRKIYVTMLQSNLGFGVVSKYMRIAAAVPIPTEMHMMRKFNRETKEVLDKGDLILFYPEAALVPYCDHIRNFLPGAFHYAVVNDKPIVPCCFTFHKPKGILKIFRRNKPTLKANVLDPYFIKQEGSKAEIIQKTTADVNKIISDFFIANSDFYYENGIKINENK